MTADLDRLVNGVLLAGFSGTRMPDWLRDAAADGLAGVVLFAHNTPDLATTAALTRSLHDVGLVVAVDEEGGDVTRLQATTGSALPGAGALGAVDDPELTREAGRALGDLLSAAGVDLDLAPVLDVNSAADNPVIGVRAFGNTPERVSRHATAFLAGLHEAGVAACGKHFPGHGATRVDSHLSLPVVPDDLPTWERRDLPPFQAAVAAGIDALMTGHVVLPALGSDLPATLDPAVTARARSLGLTGPVITDALDMGAIARDPGFGEACVRALLAGADLLCLGTTVDRDDEALYRSAHAAVTAAVRSGRLDTGPLVESVARTARLGCESRAVRRRIADPDALAAAEARLTDVGLRAARRAVRWADGSAPVTVTAPPLLIDLRTRLDHAAGRVATHLSRAVLDRWPTATTAASEPADVPGPLLVITRDAASDPGEAERLRGVLAAVPEAIVLHAGTADSAPTARHVLLTWGVGRANATAAVEVLTR